MSKYTTEVRFICETYAGFEESEGYDSIDEIVSKSRSKVFDFSYPIFDENYRPILETKILEHYYTREICEETVGLWKLRLKAKMNEIMPYYNKLYESELLEFNPLYDADYYRKGNRKGTDDNTRTNNLKQNSTNSGSDIRDVNTKRGGTDTRTGNTKNSGADTTSNQSRDKFSEWNLYSDTPQGGIEGIVGAENEPSVVDDGYLTNARHVLHDGEGTNSTSTTTYGGIRDEKDVTDYGSTIDTKDTMTHGMKNETTNTGDTKFNGKTTDEYLEHVYGRYPGKSASQLLKEFRDTFLNIDMDIINELRNLFFNLW